jgi:mRNA-degrading endonuclease RelE of RelBE toxin-antitoxin system
MKRNIILTRAFEKERDSLISKHKLLEEDYDDFERDLAENPTIGSVIPGTGGVRKIRLKSASKGKSGGFRICYYYYQLEEDIFLIQIYPKNVQENLTADEKKILKKWVDEIRGK